MVYGLNRYYMHYSYMYIYTRKENRRYMAEIFSIRGKIQFNLSFNQSSNQSIENRTKSIKQIKVCVNCCTILSSVDTFGTMEPLYIELKKYWSCFCMIKLFYICSKFDLFVHSFIVYPKTVCDQNMAPANKTIDRR